MNKKTYKLLLFLFVFIGIFFPMFFLCSCSPIESEEVIGLLLPNLWVFLAHIFATIVLLCICMWLVWKPTKESLAKRRQYIANEIKSAEEARTLAAKELANAEKMTFEAIDNAKQIVDNANSQAHIQKEKIENEAIQNGLRIKEEANNEAIKIKERIRVSMQSEILDISFSASKALLKEKISKEDNDKFVEEFITSINKVEKK